MCALQQRIFGRCTVRYSRTHFQKCCPDVLSLIMVHLRKNALSGAHLGRECREELGNQVKVVIGTRQAGVSHVVAGQRRIPQPANQHFRSAPSDDAGVVGKSGAGGHRVGVLLDESASCRYGCLRLPCAPGGPPSYHFAWWDAPQEATWRSRTPGGRYGRLIPRFGPLRCTPVVHNSLRCQYRVHRGRVRRSWPSLCS